MVRAGVQALLERVAEIEVVGATGDVLEAIQMVERLEADVLSTELDLPGFAGLQLIRKLAGRVPRPRILALTSQESQPAVEAALRSGASAFVSKNSPPKELLDAIHALRMGRGFLSPTVTEHVVSALSSPVDDAPNLTKRELEVLQLVSEGLTSKEIAVRIGVSPRTVDTHRASLMAKLGVRKASELVRVAIRDGLVNA
jgi:DNA-binding NarL/FixJ family response regulator